MKDIILLVINPGSTSTKIAVYNRDTSLFVKSINHTLEQINSYQKIVDQLPFRKKIILKTLKDNKIDINSIDCIIARGGLIKPVKSGVYEINNEMIKDLKANLLGEHASNLGGLIAHDLSQKLSETKAFIADPVVVDELEDIARYSGHPDIQRHSIFHALNHKAVARHYAKEVGKSYEDLKLIIVHMGGGISVAAHKSGRVIDVNDGLNGDGPFSPERTGGLALLNIAKLCFRGDKTFKDIKNMVVGHGGVVAYLGTNSIKDVDTAAENGDKKAEEVLNAMSYQVSKEIGAMATVLKGEVDAIILTGGVAHCSRVTDFIKKQVNFLAPVHIYPGEDEMKSLALNGLRVMSGEITPLVY